MAVSAWVVIACRMTDAQPAQLDPAHDACSYCRMVVSDLRFASQIVAPYEEPRFFDDLGCLTHYLNAGPLPKDARIFVADHRIKVWIPGDRAVYTLGNAGRDPNRPVDARRDDPVHALGGGEPVDRLLVLGRDERPLVGEWKARRRRIAVGGDHVEAARAGGGEQPELRRPGA